MGISDNFKMIDYSDIYYKSIVKKPMPLNRGGKFVQLRDEDKSIEYVVLSPGELSSFHANIIERFCLTNDIPGSYTTARKDRFEIHDGDWIIVGGGKWTIDMEKKRLVLFDQSGVYGKFDSKNLRAKMTISKFYGYKIIIHG